MRLDDEVRFIRSWLEKPLSTGAVTPSGQAAGAHHGALCRSGTPGPVIELGPGTGPVTEALVEQGVDPARLVLVEFNPTFCRLLRTRYPDATVVQGDAYTLAPPARRPAARAGRRGGLRPAAVHQAAEDAAAAVATPSS